MVKQKNYNHKELALLKEEELLRMKVTHILVIEFDQKANQIVRGNGKKAHRIIKIIQALHRQGQKRTNAQARIIKEEEQAPQLI